MIFFGFGISTNTKSKKYMSRHPCYSCAGLCCCCCADDCFYDDNGETCNSCCEYISCYPIMCTTYWCIDCSSRYTCNCCCFCCGKYTKDEYRDLLNIIYYYCVMCCMPCLIPKKRFIQMNEYTHGGKRPVVVPVHGIYAYNAQQKNNI